ncbi:gb [Venturia nashicola]|uniref:alpha-1,2-Mannosidase n=1 Tax=Venturia nashicola TaxID=86259 RepID=A0A4Z1PC96_9PEZI|nr:gb [Venturia nashicola]TLD31968.1 gb [Venturia nashicola]
MVFPIRRLFFYSVITTTYLLQATTASNCPSSPPNPPLGPWKHDRYAWSDGKRKQLPHPVTGLPVGTSKSLPRIQHDFVPASPLSDAESARKERQAAVKETFMRAWTSYRNKAWLADELAPISGKPRNDFGGWSVTLVDSLDTLWVMDLMSEFEEAVTAATKIKFLPSTSTGGQISMFEITIRHLGGFLAAYDLTDCNDQRLLEKAVEVGDMIYASLFAAPNGMPVTWWDPTRRPEHQAFFVTQMLADIASSSLELTRLSQITGDMRYYGAAARITDLLHDQQNRTKLPGMFPSEVNVRDLDLTNGTTFSFGAMSDSAYEYFGKTYQLLGGLEPQYARLYQNAMDTAIEHIIYRPAIPGQEDILLSGILSAGRALQTDSEQLACFAGGMFLLGGRLFSNETHIEVGSKLTRGCIWAYQHSPLKIMPEWFTMNACPSFEPCDLVPPGQSSFNETNPECPQKGSMPFACVGLPGFHLRPEAIESLFYLYRITGIPELQDIAWEMFMSINDATKTEFGNAAITNVMSSTVVEKEDSMESFWMAETLKYFYLMFSDPNHISLDDFVFNTEAHPFRIPR